MKRINFLKNAAIAASVVMVLALPYGCKSDDPEVRKFAVRFDSRGGSAVESQIVNEGEKVTKPADPTKANSTFVAWYKEVSLENEWDFDNETVQMHMTLYAKWNTAEGFFTVTFQTSIGSMEVTEFTIADGARVAKPADPAVSEDSGFEFITWYREANFQNEWRFNTATVSENMTLYGKWQVPFEMIPVEHGTYRMGVGTDGHPEGVAPEHDVTISRDFSMAKYPVTQIQYGVVMGIADVEKYIRQETMEKTVDKDFRGAGFDLPMYFVSWNDAQEFISRLNAATGKNYRLPTEAEWEFAARGGNLSKGYTYAGGNDVNEVSWNGNNSRADFDRPNIGGFHPVGQKLPNELGLYDMMGNVNEWMSDYYSDTYFTADAVTDPMGPDEPLNVTEEHVLRGCNWSSGTNYLSRRFALAAAEGSLTSGFRLAH